MSTDDERQGLQYTFDVGDGIESDAAWWRARGRTADETADQLDDLIYQVRPLFGRNYWGDCVEGSTTHALFRGVIETWVQDLTEQAASARNLSKACYEAAHTIATADQHASDNIANI